MADVLIEGVLIREALFLYMTSTVCMHRITTLGELVHSYKY